MSELFGKMPIPLAAQIVEVEREIGMRKHVYPRRVDNGKMRQHEADEKLAAMEAALETLREVERKRLTE